MDTKEKNIPALAPQTETLESETFTTSPESEFASTPSDILGVPVDSLPKLVVCFDITTLSHRKLKVIASGLKIPGYSRMTKAQLCEALLAL